MLGALITWKRATLASAGLALACGLAIPAGPYGIISRFWLFILTSALVPLPLVLAWAGARVLRLGQALPLILIALLIQTAIPLALYARRNHTTHFDAQSWTIISIAWMMRLAVMTVVLVAAGLSFWIVRGRARRRGWSGER
jgi:hypothetical protein